MTELSDIVAWWLKHFLLKYPSAVEVSTASWNESTDTDGRRISRHDLQNVFDEVDRVTRDGLRYIVKCGMQRALGQTRASCKRGNSRRMTDMITD